MLDEFFLTMVRLKVGLMTKDSAQRFQVSKSTVSSVFTTWIYFMYFELKNLFRLPHPDILKAHKSESFHNFPEAHLIVVCTEIFTETPSDLLQRKHLYSDYKHHDTLKFLVGISAHPAVVFVSRMYGGRASDMLITFEAADLIRTSRELLVYGDIILDWLRAVT